MRANTSRGGLPVHQPCDHRRAPRRSSSSTVTSRSPNRVIASVRGIGVAVMCSTCGASRVGLASQRRALVDAEAVLLVDHRDGRAGRTPRRPGSARACRPPPAARRLDHAAARPAAPPPASPLVRRTTRTPERRHSSPSVTRCWVGERLGGRHQRPLAAGVDSSQQRVQPPPPSCPSRRLPAAAGCIGWCGRDRRRCRRLPAAARR